MTPHNISALVRRIRANTTLADLKTHWAGISAEYQNVPAVERAKDAMEAVLK